MGNYVQLFIITATTVGKIMLCAVAGMFASRYFVEPEKSEKGLSYISVRILLPCLLFSNLCLSVTVESIRQFYSAPLLACLPLGLGLASSFLFRIVLERKYHALIMLGCTFQNGLTFPLSIILNLKGISWLDKEAVNDAQSYMFLYNVICSFGLWAVGEPLIAAAKAKEVEAEEELFLAQEKVRERQQDRLRGVSTDDIADMSFVLPFQEEEMMARAQEHSAKGSKSTGREVGHPHELTTADRGSDAAAAAAAGNPSHEDTDVKTSSREVEEEEEGLQRRERQRRSATATEQLAWYKPAKAHDHPLKPPEPVRVYTDDDGNVITLDPAEEMAVKRNQCSVSRINGILARSLKSPTVFFSLLGIAVSLIPPLRWLAESFAGQTVIGGLTVVGSGAIPLQLLVLGCTVASNKPKEDTAASDEAAEDASGGHDNADAGDPKSESPTTTRRIDACVTPSTLFIICSVGLRMIVMPATCFLIIHLLNQAGFLPNDRVFLVSMLIATSSPSAINSSVICSMHSYHSKEYARMIFFMYIASIFSTTVYLFLFILYLGW